VAKVLRKCYEKGLCTPGAKCEHSWTVRFREPGGRAGRQRERSFKLKKDADAFNAKVESDKNQGVYLDPVRGSITVRQYVDEWLSERILAPKTARDYRSFTNNHVIPALGAKRLSSLTRSDVQRLVTAMHEKGLKPSTIAARMVALRTMLGDAAKDRRIPVSPYSGIVLPKSVGRRVDLDEIPTIETVSGIAAKMGPELRLTIWLMAGAGLRISEALAVTADCVRGEKLRIYRQTTGDGLRPLKHRAVGEYREIPLPTFLADEITSHVDTFGTWTLDGVPNALFTTGGRAAVGRHAGRVEPAWMPYRTFHHAWRRAITTGSGRPGGKSDALPYTPHSLRHFFASTALAGGVSLLEVSRWLGHSSITITADTYGHLTEDAPERMRRVMDDALSRRLRVVESAG
jgi:integrase